jgi:peptidoglycan/LPS O-acetylase OafA/YrhL
VKVTTSHGRIAGLDGLRGLAILGVLLFHIDYFLGGVPQGLLPRVFHHVATFGWAGVDLFFVLSGFLITGILLDTARSPTFFRTFYIRRALRILPLYYGFLICFYGLGPLLLMATHRGRIVEHLQPARQGFAWLYLVNWFGGARHFNAFPQFIQHFWSLSVEEQFYIVWPFVVYSLKRSWLTWICGALMVVSVGSRLVLLAGGLDAAASTWTICRLDGLAVGALLAIWARDVLDRQWMTRWAPGLAVAMAVLFAVAAVASLSAPLAGWSIDAFGSTVLALLFGACLVLALSRPRTMLGSVVSHPVLCSAGRYSYGAYVWHQPIIILLRKGGFRSDAVMGALHNASLSLVVINLLPIALTAAAAFASWHLLEKHFLRLREHPSVRRLESIAAGKRAPAAVLHEA